VKRGHVKREQVKREQVKREQVKREHVKDVVSVAVSYRAEDPAVARPKRPGSWALAVRALRCWLLAYRRTWRSSVWSSVFGPLFYLGAMGYGLGSLVDKNGTASLGGVPYVEFVAPAVLAVQAMNSGLSNALFPVFGAVHWNNVYLAARATVLSADDILRGHLLFMTLRIAMNSGCFIAFMAAFGLIRSPWAALLLPAAVLTGLAFATPSAAWAVTLENQTSMNYPIRFGAVPLMLFSATFFPISQLPGWVRPVAYATPLWHGVALCRALSLGTVDAGPGDAGSAVINVAYLAAMAALGLWWGGRAYRRRLYV
jgi:lipooligosaccharide transport system permease protein